MVLLGLEVEPKRRGMGGLRQDLKTHYRDYRLAISNDIAAQVLMTTRATIFAAEAGKVVSHTQARSLYKVISTWVR